MSELKVESVVEIIGNVKLRTDRNINPNITNGTVEIDVEEYTVLGQAIDVPIGINDDGYNINEEVRLRFRYLDLRRERLQKNIQLRSNYSFALREAFQKKNFIEVETPLLTKATMEGARDFIVPSRFQPGKFYALPQSPQQYKQLLMVAGFEKYFQFARCLRDEDLRMDRGFEFTQVDIEMSFVNREDVMHTTEDIVKEAVKKVGGKLKDEIFPVVKYKDAMAKFGADKFDLRSEKEKEEGLLSFAWVINFPFFKKVDKKDAAEVRDSKSEWTFTHNPFSKPISEHEEWLLRGDNIESILTTQYDLVCNGYEVGGGSIRASTPEMLEATYKIMGYTQDEIESSIGHMLEAFKYGTPPHGGIALGLDRHVMLLAGEKSLKEVTPFPMTSTGRTSIMEAPDYVSSEQLQELRIKVESKNKKD